MNRYEEEIVTAQYADDPNDLLPPHAADPNSNGLSLGCILSIIAGIVFSLLLVVAAIGFSYFVWSSKKQNQAIAAKEPTVAVESLNANSLAEAVEVFDGDDRVKQVDIESHPDFAGINLLFQKCSEAGDWDDAETIYPYFDFKRYSREICGVSETIRFFQAYEQREIDRAVRNFGVFIPPFSKWEFVEIQQLSPNERLVYAQIQLSYDVTVKRCRVWVTKNRFAGWKIYDWEEMSSLCRASSEAAILIAEPNTIYKNTFNQYYELLETDLTETSSDAEYDRILRKCEGLMLNPKIQPSVLLNVGEYWSSIDKPKEVLRCVSKIQNKDLIPEVYRLEGNAYKELEDYESAVEKYELFIEQVGVHSDVLQSLIDCYEELDDQDKQQAYQLERFSAWPASSCYFDAREVLAFYKDEPEKLFNAIARSPESEEIFRRCFDQLAGNPFALPELTLAKEHFDKSDLQAPLLKQRVSAWLVMAEGNRDEFQRLMVDVFEQDSETYVDEKWTEAVEYGYYRKLLDTTSDKTAAFEAMARIYLFGDWYGSETDFASICDASFQLIPENRYAIYFKAYQFFQAGEFSKAMPLFKSIDGKMDGDFEYLNNSITKWRLISLLVQKQFSEALELAKQKDSVQMLLKVSIEQDSPEMLDMISDKDLEEPARLLLKGLRALEKNQNKLAVKHLSSYLKNEETSYGLTNAAIAGLVKARPKNSALTFFKNNSTYSVYRYFADTLEQNRDWQALEDLSGTALKLLKREFKDNSYAERSILGSLSEAQWRQQKYGSILKRYKALGDKQELEDARVVLWAACKASDFKLARQICEKNSTGYSYETDKALVAAFEGDVQAFSAEAKEITPYSRAGLGVTLLGLGVDDQFRRLLYQDSKAVNIEYWNDNSKSIDAVFPSEWEITDDQIQSALTQLSKATGQKFEMVKTPTPKDGQPELWAAKSNNYGVMIEAKQIDDGEFSGFASSAASRRTRKTLVGRHQQVAVKAFPITGQKTDSQSRNKKSKSARISKQDSAASDQLAASLLVSIADQPPLALRSVGGWSDDEVSFERIKAKAEGKAYKNLASIDTFYSYRLDATESDFTFEKLEFQKGLAQVFQQFQNSADLKKEFLVTVEHGNIAAEKIQVKLDEEFELLSYNQGATFTGTVAKQSEPFGIFKTGDRLEFTDGQIDQWKLKLADKVQSGQRKKK